MIRLFLAELNRLRSRRLTWVAAIGIVLALGLLQFAVYSSVKPPSAADVAEAQQSYQQAKKEYDLEYSQHKAEIDAQAQQCAAQGTPAEECTGEPQLSNYLSTPTPFAQIGGVAVAVSVFLTSLAFLLLGASFIGAEYSSGALANWLTFIPQRGKVLGAKVLALLAVTAVSSAVATGLTLGVVALLTKLVDEPITGVAKLIATGGRGVLIAMICAVIGFGLALLTRHTIAAAGTVLGYLFVAFVISGLSSIVTGLQNLKPFLPETNMLAFLQHGYTYQDYVRTVSEAGVSMDPIERTISFAHSAGYWSVVVVLVLAVAFAVFRRRDVN
jgi:ABC-2 type transport system permease protein